MHALSSRLPSYRLHKPTGLAVVTIAGRDVYLGKHDTVESRDEYDRVIAEWLVNGRTAPQRTNHATEVSVNEVLLAYLDHADSYYVKNGKPTSEISNIRSAIRPLRQLYGDTPAGEFGPLQLEAVRLAIIDSGICRSEVNRRVRLIVQAFKWAVSKALVPLSLHHGLQAVSSLKRGRCDVRETKPVRPVADVHVDAIKPHVARQVWAMAELQRLTGMRPGEACIMRTCDIDMTAETWTYVPESFKTEHHHGKVRRIPLGPKARDILRPWLRSEPMVYLFCPSEAEAERHREQRENRKTRVQPSQQNRRRRKPRRAPGERYTTESYRRAIKYGIEAANQETASVTIGAVPNWRPNQIRHSAATRLRKEFSLDTARAVLGHSSMAVTEGYAERDEAIATDAMEKIG